MRDALRLMAKVFAVVFGAGAAVVVLGYLVLGGYYIYSRIEAAREKPNGVATQPDYDALAKKYGGTVETQATAPLYDPKAPPDFLPKARLNCDEKGFHLKTSGKDLLCAVEIDGKVVAAITRQEAQANLAGWVTVPGR